MERFVLSLVGADAPELYETVFYHPLGGEERRCIRGRESGAYSGYCTFQWTKAVQALCVLFLRSAARARNEIQNVSYIRPVLTGGAGSLAVSLDYALEKQVLWLADMFGTDARGALLARRIVARSNARQRRSGPVALSLNSRFLPLSGVQVQLNFEEVARAADLERLANAIEGGAGARLPAAAAARALRAGAELEGCALEGEERGFKVV